MFALRLTTLLIFALTGCATTPQPEKPDLLKNELRAALLDIRSSLRMLAETENAAALEGLTPAQRRQSVINATRIPPRMERPITLQWVGPIEQPLGTIAQLTGYRVQVTGTRPPLPLVVTLDARDLPAIQAVHDIADQAGDRALVRVIEAGSVIALKYAQPRSTPQ